MTRKYLYPDEVDLYYSLRTKVSNNTATIGEIKKLRTIEEVIKNMNSEYDRIMTLDNPSYSELKLISNYEFFLEAINKYDANVSSTKDLKRIIGISSFNKSPSVNLRLELFRSEIDKRKDKNVPIDAQEFMSLEEIELLFSLRDKEELDEFEKDMYKKLIKKELEMNNSYNEIKQRLPQSNLDYEISFALEDVFRKIDERNAKDLSDDDLKFTIIKMKGNDLARGNFWIESLKDELEKRKKEKHTK